MRDGAKRRRRKKWAGEGLRTGEPGIDLGSCLLQANRTFQELALLKDVQEAWGVLGPQLFSFMNDSANVAALQVGPGRRAADSSAASRGVAPPAEGYSRGKAGQGRLGRATWARGACGGEVWGHSEDRPQGWDEVMGHSMSHADPHLPPLPSRGSC